MSDVPTKLIVDCQTGEETLVPYTEEEIAHSKKVAEEILKSRAEKEAELEAAAVAKASAKAKLAALGLTEEEINAL